MKNRKMFFLTLILALSLSLTTFIFAKQQSKKDDLYEQIELFASAVSIIRSDYVDEINPKDLVYGSLRGMLQALDSHSQFLTPDDYEDMRTQTEGKFGGLGIEVTIKDNVLTIVAALEDTPAFKAGLKSNDKIVRIDGKSTKDNTLTEVVKKLRGPPGTDVKLTVLREEEKRLLDASITRGIIEIESIKEAGILENGIGYVRLIEFQENTPKDLAKALATLKAKGMDSLIIDLRNNPGGLLDISVKVSEMFLPKGNVVVSTKGRAKNQDAVYKANYKAPYLNFPLIVLVNEGSASASEIVAGAIKDNKRGIIVGARTFGKGSVQTVVPLGDGSAIRLTTAKYLTPNGQPIQKEGIRPDVTVLITRLSLDTAAQTPDGEDIFESPELSEEPNKSPKAEGKKRVYDPQLERAVDLINGIKAYESLKAQQSRAG